MLREGDATHSIGDFEKDQSAEIKVPRPSAPWAKTVEPVFLVGAPRSGTTWLQAVLGTHPAIYTGTESWFFAAFASLEEALSSPRDRGVGLLEYWSPSDLYRLLGDLFRRTISALPAPAEPPQYFLEKTNLHCFHGSLILKVFPRARFLHLVRDGRAVVASLKRSARTWWKQGPLESVDAAAEEWARYVRACLRLRGEAGGDRFLEVRYESVRGSGECEISRILAWLDLAREPQLIQSMLDANRLDVGDEKRRFESIAIPAVRDIAQSPPRAYPAGFIGPAPVLAQDVALTKLQRLRVEYLLEDLLREIGYPCPDRRHLWVRILTSSRIRRLLRVPPL
jgi:hypothetical protein